ncbi:MAG TPA: excinuclease ABC subunit UvrA [Steroidobacteraceae bacterium]|jgi:excinuclease ABC subunit A|nr:excinuclease ABC subunit UvrA [Steroidobacteraceae bacterium]
MQQIRVRGARTHNLKNLNLDLPRERLIVVTGLSGSGKSSLTFDTLYAEGQRRYVESLSAYARQFLATMDKPDVDSIEGLSPAIAIEQKASSHNPRSTVGTVTEIYDYLRLLYARAGTPRCPDHGIDLAAQTVSQMVDQVLKLPEGTAVALLAPVVAQRKGEHLELLEDLGSQGFVRVRIDGRIYDLDSVPVLDPKKKHDIEAVVDRTRVRADAAQRLAESFETALKLSGGLAQLIFLDEPGREPVVFSSRHACPVCGYSVPPLEPKLFSFNNPSGACPGCDGLGVEEFFDPQRVVLHPHLSLAGGAVRGWDRRNEHYFHLIQALSKHYGFDIETPWTELPEHVRHVLLYGSGTEAIDFGERAESGRRTRQRHPFEGILPNLTRRYRETSSPMVREELARYLSLRPCPACQGTRLNRAARFVFVAERSLPEIAHLTVGRALEFLRSLDLAGWRGEVAAKIVKGMVERLAFLVDVGLEYLTLDRSAETLSGGESQRIRLASQVGSGLTGVMYILDEPSIGLHQRDNRRLLGTLKQLRDLGNTVIVVEHDEEAIRAADHVVDLGPGAGANGGHLVAEGTPREIEATPASITGQYLSGRRRIEVPSLRIRPAPDRQIRIVGARGNNLRNVTAEIPLGLLTCITGVSGSGKSTLIVDTLFGHVAARLHGARVEAAPVERIEGLEQIDRVIDIDQSPIGRTPRSNPATYTGLFAPLRELFAAVPEARARGYDAGRFSFNVKGGRCEACQGDGVIRVEMHFLPDVYVPCDICKGQRYNRETLEIRYRGRNIHEVLELTVEEALRFFQNVPAIAGKLQTLTDVGLSYVRLGQNATTLSGGEAQRVKLSRELAKRATGRTLYLLDEPTTGLHFHDVEQLLHVLHRLRDEGNTVVVIEHNLDVIKTADWVIDLGPEGGEGGGEIIATGTPETIAASERSYTGAYLRPLLLRDDLRRAAVGT